MTCLPATAIIRSTPVAWPVQTKAHCSDLDRALAPGQGGFKTGITQNRTMSEGLETWQSRERRHSKDSYGTRMRSAEDEIRPEKHCRYCGI